VIVSVTTVVLVEFEGPTGEPSVDEVESVPLLGLLVKLTGTVVAVDVVTILVLTPVDSETGGEEVGFEGLMGDPEVTEPEGRGMPQLPPP
jgi:hypothetical protein